MAERWTRERRVEHTRTVLLDAAEEVFARKGFGGAALEDIADAAGYTRGAIYSHFGAKEDLFLAVSQRYRDRFLDGFADMISSFTNLGDLDLDDIAARWRDLSANGATQAALGHEFTLFLFRNPDARARLADQRGQTIESLAEFMTARVERLGGALRIPATTLARVLMATSDGLVLASHIDGVELYRSFLDMFISNITVAER
ncbi:TetR/AcrR family transcriptional regulator [Mycolicibacterium komossense]|uniref:TetR/AcrR family transcriptional regulator n=1 Tax=Mycolicibacterium komossense TaxID=1779 RepID=A0ABT3C808_9MYCO|nr:TetR/AcrR family transcriptional regulator [Mycolicibacterium komossense]MCV7225361.1 TetR/AcrR family transcriptional regulator [Mycolicibacterium komossense]